MPDEDTLEDAEELLREVRERRWRTQGPPGGEAAGDERPASEDRGDDETMAVGPQAVHEAGGWLVPDEDEETIDVDPAVLRELRSAPATDESDEDATVVADVSRSTVSRISESAQDPPETGLVASGPSRGRHVPSWAWMAGGLSAVAALAVVAFLAGWLTSGDDTNGAQDEEPVADEPMVDDPEPDEPMVNEPEPDEPMVNEPPPERETAVVTDGAPDAEPVPDEPALPGEGVSVIAGRADWTTGHFQAEVYKQLLEELGYDVSDPADFEVGPSIAYTEMALGDLDYWPNSWYPIHLVWLEGELPDGSLVGDHLAIIGEAMIAGGLQGFLITRSFADEYGVYTMDDLNSNADALAAFDANDHNPGNGLADVFGCSREWTCSDLIDSRIAFSGWENIAQVKAGYDAMSAEAVAKVEAGEPMVVYAWTPSPYIIELRPGDNVYWMGVKEIVEGILDDSDPDGTSGVAAVSSDQCPSASEEPSGRCRIGWPVNDIRVTANNDFLAANPAAEALFETVRLSAFDVSLASVAIDGGESPSDLAAQWITDNRGLVDEWITAARSAA